jgi:hypothetical protein
MNEDTTALPELRFCGEDVTDRDKAMLGIGVGYALGLMDIMSGGKMPRELMQGVAGVARDTVLWPMDDTSVQAATGLGAILLERTRAIGQAMVAAREKAARKPALTIVRKDTTLLGPDGRRL